MNEKIFYYSLIELGISLIIGVVLLYYTYRIINKYVKQKYSISTSNLSFGIFASSILFSVGYILTGIKSPIVSVLRVLQNDPNYEGFFVLDALKYTGLFVFVIIVVVTLVNFISIKLFTWMTKDINEFEEIKKDNVSISIITAVIVIVMTLLVKDSIYLVLESFIPYPEVPDIF